MVIVLCAMLVAGAPVVTSADAVLVAKATVVTVPGNVEFVDRDMNVITIEGKDYHIHKNVKVTRKGKELDMSAVSAGAFVLATVKEDMVVGLTIMPPGQGY
jgi:hypothetical protein